MAHCVFALAKRLSVLQDQLCYLVHERWSAGEGRVIECTSRLRGTNTLPPSQDANSIIGGFAAISKAGDGVRQTSPIKTALLGPTAVTRRACKGFPPQPPASPGPLQHAINSGAFLAWVADRWWLNRTTSLSYRIRISPQAKFPFAVG